MAMSDTPLDFCQIIYTGKPCGIRSDDRDGVCVICKAQGKVKTKAPAPVPRHVQKSEHDSGGSYYDEFVDGRGF